MKLSPMRFYWLQVHSTILKNTFGTRKIDRTLVCTIATAGPCTSLKRVYNTEAANGRTPSAHNGPLSACKGPRLPERGYTVGLRGTEVVRRGLWWFKGLSNGLGGPSACLYNVLFGLASPRVSLRMPCDCLRSPSVGVTRSVLALK